MKKLALLLAAAGALATPAAPRADIGLGLRLGYSVPHGTATNIAGFGDFKQSDLYGHAVPIQLDVNYAFAGLFRAGVYASYGAGTEGTRLRDTVCAASSSCTGLRETRLGVELQAFVIPAGPFQPWVGGTFGWQRSEFRGKDFTTPTGLQPPLPVTYSADLVGSLKGWEGGLEAGLDFKLLPLLRFGPYLHYSFGQYRVQDISYGTQTVPGNGGIPSTKTHGYTTFGLRGWIDL